MPITLEGMRSCMNAAVLDMSVIFSVWFEAPDSSMMSEIQYLGYYWVQQLG
jgi:hypothetical protein